MKCAAYSIREGSQLEGSGVNVVKSFRSSYWENVLCCYCPIWVRILVRFDLFLDQTSFEKCRLLSC